MAKLEKILFGSMLVSGLTFGGVACSSKDKDKNEQKTESEFQKHEFATYGDFKECMCQITPEAMLETILVEGVKLDDNGLCMPYKDSKGIWTIGFGLTVLDGQPVGPDTRHITIQEAWKKSVLFYENKETYFFMWCYQIGMENLNIDSKGKALCLASVMYNSGSNLMEDPEDVKCHCERNTVLRDLYKKCGDSVTACQVKELFAKYPIKHPRSFGSTINGGSAQQWADALGGFTPTSEGDGMKWRRWLEGQIAMGNITSKDLLDLPMKSMSDFWYCIGAEKSALFTKQKYGGWKVNPKALEQFHKWSKNPVDKYGRKINRNTLRQVINSIDPKMVENIECGTFNMPTGSALDTYIVQFEQIRQKYSCSANNDSSYIAYQNGDYDKALEYGKLALDLASTNKQKGAATYNIGITYSAMGKYNKAIKYLQQSKSYNPRPATEEALKIAQDKKQERRKKAGLWTAGYVLGFAGCAAARKRYVMNQQRQYRR